MALIKGQIASPSSACFSPGSSGHNKEDWGETGDRELEATAPALKCLFFQRIALRLHPQALRAKRAGANLRSQEQAGTVQPLL